MYYRGIGPEEGEVVPEEVAYDYALDRCLNGYERKEFKEMLVEWYFYGNWIRVGKDEEWEN